MTKPTDENIEASTTITTEAETKGEAPLNEKVESLRACALFRDLSDEQIKKTATVFQMETYKAGDTIFKQGNMGNKIYVINKGRVSLERTVNLGDRKANVTISLLGQCRLLGCWACLLGEYRHLTESAVCQKKTRVISAEGDKIRTLLESDPQIATVLLNRLCFMLGDKIQDTYSAMDAL